MNYRKVRAEVLELINSGDVVECPNCGALNAYSWEVAEVYGIAHIPASSCWEWQCGECGVHWADADSPLGELNQ